jgi:type I restriction enzyme R subunit
MSSILSINQIEWEQLYWFLKFLIPKLDVQDQQTTGIDELLEQVDLTTYALKREHLNTSIVLDAGKLWLTHKTQTHEAHRVVVKKTL